MNRAYDEIRFIFPKSRLCKFDSAVCLRYCFKLGFDIDTIEDIRLRSGFATESFPSNR